MPKLIQLTGHYLHCLTQCRDATQISLERADGTPPRMVLALSFKARTDQIL